MPDRLAQADPVALVTGASRGIGEAVARELARGGFRLCLGARSLAACDTLAAELRAQGREALGLELDVRDRRSVEQATRAALDRFGRIDLLVANAGIGGGELFAAMSDEAVADLVDTNLLGVLRCVSAVLPAMRRQGGGAIVVIASVAGEVALPASSIYAATKAGVLRFAQGLRQEVRRDGIRVTAILPGFVRTEMTGGVAVPMPGPEVVARAVLRAYRRGPRRIVVPGWYLPLIWLARLAPPLVDLIGRRILREGRQARQG